ncbi:MAG: hypothetical protein U9R37_06620 [Campylobacterota bacterium]|nr:hypothetical protein [Campylobacterota bacterium]
MKTQVLEKIEQELKNEKIELCGGKILFEDETEKIIEKFDNLNSFDLEGYLNKQYIDTNKTYEPYRTQISFIDFLLIEILNLYLENDTIKLTTEQIHNMDTAEIEADIKDHLEYLKSLDINSPQFSKNTLNKKIQQIILSTFNNDKVEIQKQKKQKKRDMIFKALKYLTSYNVVSLHKISNQTYNIYSLNLENWFEFQRYSLYKTPILKDIIILMVAFLKYNAPNKVNDFLIHIDNIMEFLYTPPKNYEKYSAVENYIIEQHRLNMPITFETFDKDTIEVLGNNSIFEEVEMISIKIDEENKKYLKFKDDNKTYEISIEKIYRIDADENEDNSVWLKSKNCYVIYNEIYKDSVKNTNYPKEVQKHQTILEADSNILRFFETKPLENQKIYKTKNDKADLVELENLDIETSNSKIYITATETKEKIFNVVQKGVPHIKILTPKSLSKQFKLDLTAYINDI